MPGRALDRRLLLTTRVGDVIETGPVDQLRSTSFEHPLADDSTWYRIELHQLRQGQGNDSAEQFRCIGSDVKHPFQCPPLHESGWRAFVSPSGETMIVPPEPGRYRARLTAMNRSRAVSTVWEKHFLAVDAERPGTLTGGGAFCSNLHAR